MKVRPMLDSEEEIEQFSEEEITESNRQNII